jgi:hypothetical protein
MASLLNSLSRLRTLRAQNGTSGALMPINPDRRRHRDNGTA